MLHIENLNKTYTPDKAPAVRALQDINIAIAGDEFVAIIGESGSGKSTLLNILGGLDIADNGKLLIDGQAQNEGATSDLADYRREVVGFVFQDFNLISHMTVWQNVALALSTFTLSPQDLQKRVDEAIENVGLSARANNLANELSGGQKQRVAIARALVKNPKVILADEPTGALDSATSSDILELFKTLSAQGKLVIMVTHDPKVAGAANRCIRLQDGRVIEDVVKAERLSSAKPAEDGSLSGERSFNLSSVFALSWHRIIEKRWRYLMISLGISVGIAGLILAQTLGTGVSKFLQTSSNQIIDSRKVTVIQKDLNFDSDIIFEFRKTGATEIIQAEHVLQARFDKRKSTEYFGVKPLHKERNRDAYATPIVLNGELPAESSMGIAITPSIARQILGDDKKSASLLLGTQLDIKLMSPDTITRYPSRWDSQSFTISGIIKASFVGEDYAYISYQDHINIAGRSRFIAKNDDIPTNTYHIYLKDKLMVPEFAAGFKDRFEVITPENVLKSITSMFSQIQIAIYSVSGLILLICGIMAGILFFISVLERQKEIGIFKALGGNNRDVRWILFSEAILIGCIAAVIGAVVSIFISLGLDGIIYQRFGYALLALSPMAIIFGMVFGVLVTSISAIQPANNAARLDPIKLLRKD